MADDHILPTVTTAILSRMEGTEEVEKISHPTLGEGKVMTTNINLFDVRDLMEADGNGMLLRLIEQIAVCEGFIAGALIMYQLLHAAALEEKIGKSSIFGDMS